MKTKTDSTYHHGNLQQALLKAAEDELIEKGVKSFSMRSVAKRAGVSHGAPAHHFKDKTGVLTALAAEGYRRFIRTQEERQREASPSPRSQLAASGLGYIDFAISHSALFRLMFSSEHTNRQNKELHDGANKAFDKLITDVCNIIKIDPNQNQQGMMDVMAAWVAAHGLADLMITNRFERMAFFENLDVKARDKVFSDIILRSIKMSSAKEIK
ncbi:TetR/AcrR family transcriptional regulator [Glaciecola sp. 2405UD65-10]|uniref:TetR/AcrR family transcriptional regulator n=1 Tax=Glaciecola sp. 2405UD65-10 TaxID=3397244 RepID=UPI003B58B781